MGTNTSPTRPLPARWLRRCRLPIAAGTLLLATWAPAGEAAAATTAGDDSAASTPAAAALESPLVRLQAARRVQTATLAGLEPAATAALVDLAPAVGEWYLLALAPAVGPSAMYHLESVRPGRLELLPDGAALRFTSTDRREVTTAER